MKTRLLNISLMKPLIGVCALLSAGLLSGCFEEPNEMAILDDTEVVIPLLTERIEAREDLSYFAALLKGARMDAEVVDEKTDIATPVTVNFWNTFSGYGTYTLFAPNNAAVQEWLSAEFPQIDRTSPATVQSGIEALDEDDMLKVTNTIQYHICADSIPSKLFVMGKFPYPTLLGSFLLLGKEQAMLDGDAEPRAYTVFNKTAHMIGADINAGNGYMHVLDKMLEPETRTIAQIVADLGDNYSIFKSIFSDRSVTDMDSVLNVVYTTSTTESGRKVKKNVKYTLFVHSDAAFERFFRAAGIVSYTNGIEALKTYLDSHRQEGDERDNDELLNVWAQYHVLLGEYYINDLIKLCGARGTMTTTMADNETLGLKYLNDIVRLNRDDERQEDGSFDTGGRLFPDSYINAHPGHNLPYSDMGATNGVIHFVDKVYSMKVTKSKALFWDVADQALISTHPSYRNKNGSEITNMPDGITLIPDYFPDFKVTATWGSKAEVRYLPAAGWDNSKTCHVYGDRITLQVGSNRIRQLEITTPSLNKGRYYVWFCFRHQGSGTCNVVLTHNGVANKRTKYFDYWGSRSDSDPVNAGYKRFVIKDYQMSCHLIGQINVTANGPQVMTLDLDRGSSNGLGAWLDMIQFIPIDDNQAWPKFDACGIMYYETPSKYNTDPYNCPVQEVDDDEEPLPED